MQRIPVDSSDVVSVGYDAKTRVLEIEFGGGRIYQYTDVPADVHERFMRADSPGTYFNTFVNAHYRYHRADEREGNRETPEAVGFVTGNARKFRDFELACAEFHIKAEQLKLPVDEIQGHDAETIAIHKAKEAYRLAGRPVVVNDAYWNILALRGFPGAYMAYMVGWLKAEDWLALMQSKQDRTIGCTDTLVYYDGKRSKVFSGVVWGKITEEARGEGISLDQVVVINGQTRTIAEIENANGTSSIDIKDSIWYEFAKWYNMQRRLRKV
jgi:XTP/dITP diphosphohydrolase